MSQNLQSGTHLDADELSMFVDGTARAHERDRMLAHLGQCAECRRVVFLMQGPEEPAASTAVTGRSWIGRRWALPVGFAGAAVACGLVLAVYFIRHRGASEIAGQSARVQAPAVPAGAAPVANDQESPNDTGRAKSDSGPTATNSKDAKQNGSANGKALRSTAVPASRGAAGNPKEPVDAAGALAVADDKTAGARAESETQQPPAPAAQRQVAKAPPAGKDEAESAAFAVAKSVPPLRIEHDRGPDDGLSEVTGRVTDMSGAVIPGAQISLRDSAGRARETTSGGDGNFSLAGVPPGHYELNVTSRGFQASHQTVDLKPRDMAMLDSVLTVGAAAETVTVESEALALNTESASVAGSEIAPLPSHVPVAKTVSLGKHMLSLDEAGTLFVSRNGGKSWKKVKPQWTGKLAQIELSNLGPGENLNKRKKTSADTQNTAEIFRLTTDSGAVWTSDDGAHWTAQ